MCVGLCVNNPNCKSKEPRKLDRGICTWGNLRCSHRVFFFYFYIPSVYGLHLKNVSISDMSVRDAICRR
jgi:hypothetical protein